MDLLIYIMKQGDKVVCICNTRGAFMGSPRLYVGKTYTVKDYHMIGFSATFISLDEHPQYSYTEKDFITQSENRRNKLNKLNNCIIWKNLI